MRLVVPLRTIVDPVAEVALPAPLVQEGDEGVDVRPARATANDGAGRDHREVLDQKGGQRTL